MQKVLSTLKKKTYFKASKNVEDKYLHLSHTRSLYNNEERYLLNLNFNAIIKA